MAEVDKISCSLSLMRRLPPAQLEQNLSGLLNLVPEETDELLQRVDQPLEEATDAENGRNYLLCDYNRDGDSYRSPWSNNYDPPIPSNDGFLPSDSLRQIEVEANELFDAYREHYYAGGTSSVYLWDLDNGFAGCFLIKKSVENNRFVKAGSWDSIHVVEVVENGSRATYKLTTTVILKMDVDKAEVGDTSLSGNLTRQAEQEAMVSEQQPHLVNIGKMIEQMEIDLRSNIDALYLQKTREIMNSIRTLSDGPSQGTDHTDVLNEAVRKHGATRKTDSEGR